MSAADKERNQVRFETELEFVQSLANPFYLESLAQRNTFTDPAFLNYLDYLQYWRKPQYARFLQYPHCLHHLELLQPELNKAGEKEPSRLALALKLHPNLAQDIAAKQLAHWAGWRETGGVVTTAGVKGGVKEEGHDQDDKAVV